MTEKKNWVAWHEKYDEQSSDLSERLKIVRSEIEKTLPENPETTFRILDICAGDGRDLIPVLGTYGHNKFIQARLIEIDHDLASRAESAAKEIGLEKVKVIVGDAANTEFYKDMIPADLILFCGVFGNIHSDDIENIIITLPEFCKQGSKVIWTRNRREPDITPWIRQLFSENGFSEMYFIAPSENTYAIGINEFEERQLPYKGNRTLFTFTR